MASPPDETCMLRNVRGRWTDQYGRVWETNTEARVYSLDDTFGSAGFNEPGVYNITIRAGDVASVPAPDPVLTKWERALAALEASVREFVEEIQEFAREAQEDCAAACGAKNVGSVSAGGSASFEAFAARRGLAGAGRRRRSWQRTIGRAKSSRWTDRRAQRRNERKR